MWRTAFPAHEALCHSRDRHLQCFNACRGTSGTFPVQVFTSSFAYVVQLHAWLASANASGVSESSERSDGTRSWPPWQVDLRETLGTKTKQLKEMLGIDVSSDRFPVDRVAPHPTLLSGLKSFNGEKGRKFWIYPRQSAIEMLSLTRQNFASNPSRVRRSLALL